MIGEQLVRAMGLAFKRSKRWLYFHISVLLAVLLITAISYIGDWSSVSVFVIAVILFVSQMGIFFIKHKVSYWYNLGEKIRWKNQLFDGLGVQISADEIAGIYADIGESEFDPATYKNAYFESAEPKGPMRTLEIIRESSFFTARLSKFTANVFTIIAAFSFIIIILVTAYVLCFLPMPVNRSSLVKVLFLGVSFFMAGELASLRSRYESLATKSNSIFEACSRILLSRPPAVTLRDNAFLIVGEYNSVLAPAPPIMGIVFWLLQDKLNNLWSRSRSLVSDTSDKDGK